jgi:tetratricopeptide (TPR) repeat protein
VEQRLRSTAEAGALAQRANDPAATFWAQYWRGFAVFEAGDMSETERSLKLASDIAAKIRQPMLQWVSAFARSWRSLLTGDVQSAEDLASHALQIGTESGQPDAAAVFGALLLSVRWYQGRLDEVSDLVATVADDNPGIPGFRAAQGLCLVESGRMDEAGELLSAALERSFTHDDNLLWLTTMVLWAEVAGHLGHREAASALADLLRPFGNRVCFNGVNVYGAVDHYLGHLTAVAGDLTAAELHFSRALSINEGLGSPFFVSRTKLELSRMLLDRRGPEDESRARTMLAEALDVAGRNGCALVKRRAAKLLEEAP